MGLARDVETLSTKSTKATRHICNLTKNSVAIQLQNNPRPRALRGIGFVDLFFLLRRSEYPADGNRVEPYIIRVKDIMLLTSQGAVANALSTTAAVLVHFRGFNCERGVLDGSSEQIHCYEPKLVGAQGQVRTRRKSRLKDERVGTSGGAAGGGGAVGGSGGAGGGGAVGGAGNPPQVNQQQNNQARTVTRASSKPPRFEGTFEVYREELEIHLDERGSWDVVPSAEVRDPNAPAQSALFDTHNRIARAAILRGLRGCQNDDTSKVCVMWTAKEMWDTLVADKTQREFSYGVMLKRQLYHGSPQEGESMAGYLTRMTKIRQQLANLGAEYAVTDHQMVDALMMGVSLTHQSLVEQFDLPMREGHRPSLQQVSNALRSQDDLNRMVGQVNGTKIDGEAVVMQMSGPVKSQRQTTGGKPTSAKKKLKCFHCGKAGHFRRGCWHYKRNPNKVHGDQNDASKTGSAAKPGNAAKKKKKNSEQRRKT